MALGLLSGGLLNEYHSATLSGGHLIRRHCLVDTLSCDTVWWTLYTAALCPMNTLSDDTLSTKLNHSCYLGLDYQNHCLYFAHITFLDKNVYMVDNFLENWKGRR